MLLLEEGGGGDPLWDGTNELRDCVNGMADKGWRLRRNRLGQILSIVYNPPPPPSAPLRRTVYLCTALVAFTLGLSIGLMVPVYVVPKRGSQIHNATSKSPIAPVQFQGVSFVSNGTNPEKKGLIQGVFWSEEVEGGLPRGYGEPEAKSWERFVRSTPVVKVEEGCGRMQNRLVTFEGGVKACARYRQNTDQIQGELFSFYLGRELGLANLAPSAPAAVEPESRVWSGVRSQLALAKWSAGRPLVLTRFVEGLEPAPVPRPLRNTSRRLHPPDASSLPPPDATELAQWSDLVLFDYLTANLDRVVNNLYNLQWNPGMMDAPAHNLARRRDSKLLLFLDNESGLLHGYRLLDKYESYHSVLLDALCVFRKSTVEAIERLRRTRQVGPLLNARLAALSAREILPPLPENSIKILNRRLDRVHDQIAWCQKQYQDR